MIVYAATIIIIVVNMILEYVVNGLVEWVGYDTKTDKRLFTIKCMVPT